MNKFKNFEEMIKGTSVTLITKKAKKEFEVFVGWYDEKNGILCGLYTNRFGKLAVKQFDMNKYDICL